MDLLCQSTIDQLKREIIKATRKRERMLRNATKSLARRALPNTTAKAERSAESQAMQVLARRTGVANSRSITTSRARLNVEKVRLSSYNNGVMGDAHARRLSMSCGGADSAFVSVRM